MPEPFAYGRSRDVDRAPDPEPPEPHEMLPPGPRAGVIRITPAGEREASRSVNIDDLVAASSRSEAAAGRAARVASLRGDEGFPVRGQRPSRLDDEMKAELVAHRPQTTVGVRFDLGTQIGVMNGVYDEVNIQGNFLVLAFTPGRTNAYEPPVRVPGRDEPIVAKIDGQEFECPLYPLGVSIAHHGQTLVIIPIRRGE